MASAVNYIQANTNGRLHDAREPAISPLDRGFLYGDAIYEVWRTYDRVIFAWEEHLARLEASGRSVGLGLPWTADFIWTEVARTAAAFRETTGFGATCMCVCKFHVGVVRSASIRRSRIVLPI
jgi:branched-chain amino acid aminotransferase